MWKILALALSVSILFSSKGIGEEYARGYNEGWNDGHQAGLNAGIDIGIGIGGGGGGGQHHQQLLVGGFNHRTLDLIENYAGRKPDSLEIFTIKDVSGNILPPSIIPIFGGGGDDVARREFLTNYLSQRYQIGEVTFTGNIDLDDDAITAIFSEEQSTFEPFNIEEIGKLPLILELDAFTLME